MLDDDTTFLFLKLKQKLEKKHKVKMSNRELLHSLMQEKLESLDAPKSSTKNSSTGTSEIKTSTKSSIKNPSTGTSQVKTSTKISTQNPGTGTSRTPIHSRHIPASQKREIINKTDGQCIYGNCQNTKISSTGD